MFFFQNKLKFDVKIQRIETLGAYFIIKDFATDFAKEV